ncbi:zwei Ig domain protein zig-8-like [Palaemon carinicauda]|uniref:zwei Ig domain protein zig-8-like n=1 Tax=Palaemon carinicauda TaxID=392227 RepID=UPI0035B5B39E
MRREMLAWKVLVLITALAWAVEETGPEDLPAHKRQSVQYSTLVGPSFVNTTLHSHAHALIGQTAYLTCIVKNLHNYTISWVRARDIHLLTAGETTYTSDNRFVAVNPGGGDQWMLRIHHAQPSDAGTYLCQVSVSPPVSTSITLLVTDAVASVRPGTDVYLKAGSRVVLVCKVYGCPYPALPSWYKGYQLQEGTETEEGRIERTSESTTVTPTKAPPSSSSSSPYESLYPFSAEKSNYFENHYISLEQESSTSSTTPTTVVSTSMSPTPVGLPVATVTLIRPKALSSHSGVYTCTNTCTHPINLTLHVITGDEEIAAMQHPSSFAGLFVSESGIHFLKSVLLNILVTINVLLLS